MVGHDELGRQGSCSFVHLGASAAADCVLARLLLVEWALPGIEADLVVVI